MGVGDWNYGMNRVGREGRGESVWLGFFLYDILGEDAQGNLLGRHHSTGIGRPKIAERARYFGEEDRLAAALDASEEPDAKASSGGCR